MLRWFGSGAAALMALFVAVMPWWRDRSTPSIEPLTVVAAMSLVRRTLEREDYEAALDAGAGGGRFLLHGRRPRLFGSPSPASTLRCMQWTASGLHARGQDVWLSAFSAVGDGNGTAEFVLARGREAEFERSESVTINPDISLAQLLEEASTTILYHAGSIDSWGQSLEEEARELYDAFQTLDAPAHVNASQWPPSAVNAWLGGRGVLATPHFDPSHNVVVQVIGQKRWLLWPPSMLPDMRLHAASHPSRRQTRLQLQTIVRDHSTSAGAAATEAAHLLEAAISVVLSEGDVLYVPPFWTHGVLSTGGTSAGSSEGSSEGISEGVGAAAGKHSLSLSLISASWVEIAWHEAKRIVLPFGAPFAEPKASAGRPSSETAEATPEATSEASRVAGVGRYVIALLGSREDAQSFIGALYHERHAPITTRDAARAAEQRLACTEGRQLPLTANGEHAEQLRSAAAEIWRLLAFSAEQPQQRFDESVRPHLLRDYVDELVAWAVGEELASSLLRCWAARPQIVVVDGTGEWRG